MYCDTCGEKGPVKPDIVFFGEDLPEEMLLLLNMIDKCDLLIVIGTALAVSPVNQCVNLVSDDAKKVLINLTNTKENGFDFDNKEYKDRLFL